MPKLVKDGDITEDYWSLLECSAEDELDLAAVKKGNVLLPLDCWLKNEASVGSMGKVGVWIGGDTALSAIPEQIFELPVIGIHFPAFADGRGFSLARQIREYADYSGDIRAVGNFALDQLYFLKRCGFSSFVVDGNDQAIHECLNAFTDSYQAAVDEPRPLFRRRS